MDRSSVNWRGYIPAITTPFGEDEELRWDDFALQVEWLLKEQMDGIIVAGTTGEWFSLSTDERAQLFTEAACNVAGRVPVLGGCNALTAKEAIVHARNAQRAGLDGILLAPPPYVVPTRREAVQFYRDVSDAIEIPICVYNWPRGSIVDLDLAALEEIAELEHVVALKNSTKDAHAFLASLYTFGDSLRVFGLPTSALGVDLAMAGRGDGLMGSAGVLGRDHAAFWHAVAAGDRAEALRVGARDRVIMERWFGPDYGAKFGNATAIMKTALRYRGVPAGRVRRPLLELTPAEVQIVHDTLRSLDIEPQPLP